MPDPRVMTDRLEAIKYCLCIGIGKPIFNCNHGGGFLGRYDWGFMCGNCGATWKFPEGEKSDA